MNNNLLNLNFCEVFTKLFNTTTRGYPFKIQQPYKYLSLSQHFSRKPIYLVELATYNEYL